MSDRYRIYVAGPMSKGDFMENIHTGLRVGRELFMEGFAPYVPHLDAYMFPISQAETPEREVQIYNELLEWDFAWIEVSDALIRLPGVSAGADREVAWAESLAIPVFYEMDELYDWVATQNGHKAVEGNQDWPTYAQAIGAMNGMEGCE